MQQANHPLAIWLKAEGRYKSDFARELDVSAAHLTLVCKNKRGLSPKKAALVEEMTGGAVTMAQLAQTEVSR
jgi:DNA-binding transcriptional regulator YdaS (Cro superfamily)